MADEDAKPESRDRTQNGAALRNTGSNAGGELAVILFALMVALCAAPFLVHLRMDSYTGDRYVAEFTVRWAITGVIWGLLAYWLGTTMRRMSLFGEHIITVFDGYGTGKVVHTEIFVTKYLADKAMPRLRQRFPKDQYAISQGFLTAGYTVVVKSRYLGQPRIQSLQRNYSTLRGLNPSDLQELAEKTHYKVETLMKAAEEERRNTKHPGAIILFFLKKYSSLLASLASIAFPFLYIFIKDWAFVKDWIADSLWARDTLPFLFLIAWGIAVFYLHRQLQDWPDTIVGMIFMLFGLFAFAPFIVPFM